jgi:anti-sigma factor RsiW
MSETHLGDAVHAYLDNELSADRALDVRSHLASCARCRQEYEAIRALRGVLHRTLKPADPSPEFLRRLRHAVRRSDPGRWRTRSARIAWASGPLAAAALVVLVAVPMLQTARPDLTGEVVAAHVRSLQADHLTDVASSDRHTVKPWFQGKLPFSFPVRDLREQGFALEGGRLDYVGGRPVAALVYRARQHAINVLVWADPDAPDSAPRAETRSGINSLHWVTGGMAWWVVSDVSDEEIRRLAALLQEPGT